VTVHHTTSAAETIELGRALSSSLQAGDVVAFYGDLGSGKTTMIKGIAAGLGVTEVVKSPSFVIITEYRGRIPVYHIDLYRLAQGGGRAELEDLGLDAYLGGDGVCLVEWAERGGALLPADAVRVRMSVTDKGRRIEVEDKRPGNAGYPARAD
jgi:tRNA threonylcarbamoyladenosine biosynthesis protein TsaE